MRQKNNSQTVLAYESIRDQIISYTLSPGSAISDNKLAKELGMSRAPIREAILRLQMDGLIRVNNDGKMIVAPIGIDDIVDILHIRCALESEVVVLIAETNWLNAEQEQKLQEIHYQMKESMQQSKVSNEYLYDDLFHSTLIGYANSDRIEDILGRMRLQMQRVRWLNVANSERHEDAIKEHEEILACLLAHNQNGCIQALRTHFYNSAAAFRAVLENKQMQTLAAMISNFFNSK